jgi:aminoglycoside phosphotransferase (APT) family kinase protein
MEWMPRIDEPINLAAGQQYRDAWPLFVERIGNRVPEGSLALGERVQAVFEDLLVSSVADAPLAVCHGDFRGDNLMFDDRAHPARPGDEVAVLDWQISYRGPAVSDIAYFLCQSLEVEERRRHESELVRAWYDELTETVREGSGDDLDAYPFELAWEQYRRSALGTTVYPVTGVGALDPGNERGQELLTAMAVRAFTACLDLDAASLLP